MDYIHIKNLEKYQIELSSEAHFEKILIKNWKLFFNFNYYATRLKISKRSIVDLVGVDENYFYLIELKFRPIRYKDKLQIRRYVRDFLHDKPIKTVLLGYNRKDQKIEIVL